MNRLTDVLRAMFPGKDAAGAYGHLVPNRRYTVARTFMDYDGAEHGIGETWTFLRHDYLPYEDGLTIHVRMSDGRETVVRLQHRAETQGIILDDLERYLVAERQGPGS